MARRQNQKAPQMTQVLSLCLYFFQTQGMVLVLALLMFATARASHEHVPCHGITSLEWGYDVARYAGVGSRYGTENSVGIRECCSLMTGS